MRLEYFAGGNINLTPSEYATTRTGSSHLLTTPGNYYIRFRPLPAKLWGGNDFLQLESDKSTASNLVSTAHLTMLTKTDTGNV